MINKHDNSIPVEYKNSENKKDVVARKWMGFAVGEGSVKATSTSLAKLIGVSSGSLVGVVVAGLVSAVVQFFGGAIFAKRRAVSLRVTRKQLIGAICFGIVATIMGIVGTYAFTLPGADVGVFTFIVISAIVPGAIVDRVFFNNHLKSHQLVGIAVFLFAGWAMLNFPAIFVLLHLPLWILWTLTLPILAVINEAITQWQARSVEKLDTMVNNFWIGLSTAVFSLLVMAFLGTMTVIFTYPPGYWIASLVRGGLVIVMIAFKLLAYQAGGTIAIKKFIMFSSFLMLATLFGVIFFFEPFTIGKIVGIIAFGGGFVLLDESTWAYLRRHV